MSIDFPEMRFAPLQNAIGLSIIPRRVSGLNSKFAQRVVYLASAPDSYPVFNIKLFQDRLSLNPYNGLCRDSYLCAITHK
jgi:hypothetical protein